MPRKTKRRKLVPARVRATFKNHEPVATTATKFGVSPNLIYLVRARRIHPTTTQKMRAPRRVRHRRWMIVLARRAAVRIDLERLANRIVRNFLKRLRGRR
jgi:hypothetical protein